ncbi:MAG: hypothetical protein HY952_12440 [Elusimicrobia bacterium]|jgi:fatty acid desaturase|nr:hypothetical protein [Elusimicrobiota bacterium]
MDGKHLARPDDVVEPELLGTAGSRPRADDAFYQPPQRPGLLARLKFFAAAALGLLAAVLFFCGALLTSTVIGAIIGIPLMLAGAVVFFLLFKLLTLGSKNSFIIRRF